MRILKMSLLFFMTLPLWAGHFITVKLDSLSYRVDLDTMKTIILHSKKAVPVEKIVMALKLPADAKYRFIGDDGYYPEKDIPFKKLKYGFIYQKNRNLYWTSKADLTHCYNVKKVKFIKVIK